MLGHMSATAMKPSDQFYYRWAGYWSLPCLIFPFLLELAGGVYLSVNFVFGCAGLLFAISGLWRGSLGAKICSVISLFVFYELARDFIYWLCVY
jgi:hypothetical protein